MRIQTILSLLSGSLFACNASRNDSSLVDEPEEDVFDMPSTWGQVYLAVLSDATDVVVNMRQISDHSSTEHFRLRFEVVDE